jgi:hypothetical protein
MIVVKHVFAMHLADGLLRACVHTPSSHVPTALKQDVGAGFLRKSAVCSDAGMIMPKVQMEQHNTKGS